MESLPVQRAATEVPLPSSVSFLLSYGSSSRCTLSLTRSPRTWTQYFSDVLKVCGAAIDEMDLRGRNRRPSLDKSSHCRQMPPHNICIFDVTNVSTLTRRKEVLCLAVQKRGSGQLDLIKTQILMMFQQCNGSFHHLQPERKRVRLSDQESERYTSKYDPLFLTKACANFILAIPNLSIMLSSGMSIKKFLWIIIDCGAHSKKWSVRQKADARTLFPLQLHCQDTFQTSSMFKEMISHLPVKLHKIAEVLTLFTIRFTSEPGQ
jgi:hypothetical protein